MPELPEVETIIRDLRKTCNKKVEKYSNYNNLKFKPRYYGETLSKPYFK